jgi:hypothetical protein
VRVASELGLLVAKAAVVVNPRESEATNAVVVNVITNFLFILNHLSNRALLC